MKDVGLRPRPRDSNWSKRTKNRSHCVRFATSFQRVERFGLPASWILRLPFTSTLRKSSISGCRKWCDKISYPNNFVVEFFCGQFRYAWHATRRTFISSLLISRAFSLLRLLWNLYKVKYTVSYRLSPSIIFQRGSSDAGTVFSSLEFSSISKFACTLLANVSPGIVSLWIVLFHFRCYFPNRVYTWAVLIFCLAMFVPCSTKLRRRMIYFPSTFAEYGRNRFLAIKENTRRSRQQRSGAYRARVKQCKKKKKKKKERSTVYVSPRASSGLRVLCYQRAEFLASLSRWRLVRSVPGCRFYWFVRLFDGSWR